eukprot:938035_1
MDAHGEFKPSNLLSLIQRLTKYITHLPSKISNLARKIINALDKLYDVLSLTILRQKDSATLPHISAIESISLSGVWSGKYIHLQEIDEFISYKLKRGIARSKLSDDELLQAKDVVICNYIMKHKCIAQQHIGIIQQISPNDTVEIMVKNTVTNSQMCGLQRGIRQHLGLPLFANEKERARIIHSVDSEHVYIPETKATMTVSKTHRLAKNNQPVIGSWYAHRGYDDAIAVQIENVINANKFEHITPFKETEIVVHWGSDKCTAATTNSIAPLITKTANTPKNTQLTELWLYPANDSAFNQQQAMNIEMFNQLLLRPANVILFCDYVNEDNEYQRRASVGTLLMDTQAQKRANTKLSPNNGAHTVTNPYERDKIELKAKNASVNQHTANILQIIDFAVFGLDISVQEFLEFNNEKVQRIVIPIALIQVGFIGFLAISVQNEIVGTICVDMASNLNRSADVFVHGYILGRCHHHTKMDISNIDNLHCNADITKYFQGTHIQDLYPQSMKRKSEPHIVNAWSWWLLVLILVSCLFIIRKSQLHDTTRHAHQSLVYRTSRETNQNVLNYWDNKDTIKTLASTKGIKSAPIWNYRLCRTGIASFHIVEGVAGIIWEAVLCGVRMKLMITNGWKQKEFEEYAEIQQQITTKAMDLQTLQYVFDAFKDQESSTIHDNQEMYQEELAIMSHDLCELYTKLAEKCDASPNTTKYKEFLATAQQNGINEHCYKKNSMQGKTAINLKKSVHQMSQYIVNIDEELSKDYYEMIFAFDLMCSVVCKKCDGQRKDSKVIDSWIKRIQYFIKIYYQFVGKYRNTKGGRANFGFKIHLLWHVCDWIEYFGISPAHIDEQRIEHLHVVINRAIKMFGAVQGRDKLKHIMRYVSLHSLYA